jgi:hypothetical protein
LIVDLIVEVLRIANDVAYGLGANVFTENTGCAMRMAHGLEAGSIWVRFLCVPAMLKITEFGLFVFLGELRSADGDEHSVWWIQTVRYGQGFGTICFGFVSSLSLSSVLRNVLDVLFLLIRFFIIDIPK